MSEKIWSYEFEKHKEVKAGQLLLSEPFMFDENFRRTVVLICEQNEQNGTVGLILNKPVNLRIEDVIDNFPHLKTKLFLGGPVGTDTMQFLHSLGDVIDESVKLADNLYWGGNFEQLKAMILAGEVKTGEVRFFLGYSGWANAQLKEELKANSWIIAKAKSSHVFQADFSNLWRDIMLELGGVYSTMASYPENPTLN